YQREAGLAPHSPYSMSQVLPKAFKPGHDPHGAGVFARERRIAPRSRSAALAGEIALQHFPMALHLLRDARFDALTALQIVDAAQHVGHSTSQAVCGAF